MGHASLAPGRSPIDVLGAIAGEPGAFLLEVPDAERPVTLVGCRPVDELVIDAADRDPFATIAAFVDATPLAAPNAPFPLAGGVVACLAYELGVGPVTGRRPRATDGPLAVLRRYDPLMAFDHRAQRWHRIGRDTAEWLGRAQTAAPAWERPLGRRELAAALDRDAYHAAVATIHAYLRAGDV